MPDVIVFIPNKFPYTFPFTFGKVDIGVQAAAHEPVLPIEYRYTLPAFFLVQEPSTWLGYIEVLQGMEELLMPIWPSEDIYGAIHNFPYYFGGTDLDADFFQLYSKWWSPSIWLMPEYPSEMLFGTAHTDPPFFMQLSTPIFDPDGRGVKEPGQAPLLNEGAGSATLLNEGSGSVELVGPSTG
tara:strand:- start:43 stop:591 length:549 start_codon:yes stop_codon:yes gene_type:complete